MTELAHLNLPAGAWDCHVHVVGPRSDYPMLPDRHYTPGPASVDDLKSHLEGHGLSRAVIVQPSFYGVDNRCMLESLARLDGAGRGIAVLPEQVTETELRQLTQSGIRGIRINLESAATQDPAAISAALLPWARRIAPFGWHIQIYAALNVIAAAAEQIERMPVPIVLDHFAMIPATIDRKDSRLRAVLALLRAGNTYVKLSAPYRISPAPLESRAAISELAQMLHAANPERVLWASDWPYTNREEGVAPLEVSRYRDIPPAMLSLPLDAWAARPDVLEQIFIVNPQRLYG
jgi:predicted TIM-barrel fold metal-dependent hydrolase